VVSVQIISSKSKQMIRKYQFTEISFFYVLLDIRVTVIFV